MYVFSLYCGMVLIHLPFYFVSLQSSILLTKSKGKLSTKSKVLNLPKEAFSVSFVSDSNLPACAFSPY